MCFELTGALIDQILFCMEDQKGKFAIDTQEGVAADCLGIDPGGEPGGRYIDLPDWDSSEGFALMERFTAGFKNVIIRDQLTAALNRGRGVFRAFKDVLGAYPEAEQRWFSFKDREMRRVILRWYNALREEWGLERIGEEPEETGDLVLEDFRFRDGEAKDAAAAAALHERCLKAGEADRGWVFPGILTVVAENGAGDFAGYAAAQADGSEGFLRIAALEVRSEYRGLGIGEALLVKLVEKLRGKGTAITVDLGVESEGFSRVLLRESFSPCFTRYTLNLTPQPDAFGVS